MQTNDNTPRKGAMLLRKSRADIEKEEIGKFETLARHETELRALARRLELAVDDVYREIVSGNDFGRRDGFKALMAKVESREYAYVIVHAVDRLSRGDLMENGWILSTFHDSETLIVTPQKIFDPRNKMDLQQLQFILLFANFEYSTTNGRLQGGRTFSASSGCYISRTAPYGYDKAETSDKKKTIVPNGDAKYVREMYRRLAAGETKSAIARDFNKRGVKTTLDRSWTPTAVKRIVENPAYKGVVRWGRMQTVIEGRIGIEVRKVTRVNDNPILVPGIHEALVSEELWQEANEKAIVSPRTKKGHTLRNPLARVLVCKRCGRTMDYAEYGKRGGRPVPGEKGHLYYRHKHYSKCSAKGLKMHTVDEVISAVTDALADMASECEVRVAEGDDGVSEHNERLESMRSAIARLERKKDKIVELYTADAIDLAEFRDRRSPIDKDIAELAKALAEEEAFTPKPVCEVAAQLREAIAMLSDSSLTAEERNNAVCAVVERIEYEDVDGKLNLEVHLRE